MDSATLINYPLSDVLKMFKVAQNAMLTKDNRLSETLEFLIDLSKKARQDGVLALGEVSDSMDDKFGQKGLQLVVDKVDSGTVNDILSSEINFIEERHEIGQKIFKSMAGYSPAFGMVGTLIGLIQMLQKLDDPSQIGVGMAVALVTTLYGVIFANLFYIPMAGKLETRTR
jgi:chemotaxis protein MotA